MDKKSSNLCRIYVVRHGETEWNVERRLQGQQDSPLTEKGIDQAKVISKMFSDKNFDAVYASDLFRAKKTAEVIALEKKMIVKTSEMLRERSFGKHEGKLWAEYRNDLSDSLNALEKLNDKQKYLYKVDEDVESDEEVMSRFFTFLREVALANLNKKVLVVTHGGVMRTALVHLGEFDELIPHSISNLGYFVLESDGVEFFVKEKHGISEKGK